MRSGQPAESLAVRDLPRDTRPIISHKLAELEGERIEEIRNLFLDRSQKGAQPDQDAALTRGLSRAEVEAPLIGATQFDGLSNADNFASFGFRLSPPDTNMDVGPNDIVQATNLLVRIFDKSGSPRGAAFRMSALFASLGGVCSTHDDGDPVVLYDPLADRWLLTQFTYEENMGGQAIPNRFCVAVSKTSDPTGAYWTYQFASPITAFQDYPHYGVWSDGYYMTTHQFATPAMSWAGAGIFALEREKMLQGQPAQMLYGNLGSVDLNIGGMLPADVDGVLPPPPGAPAPFVYFTANEYGDPQDALRIFDFHSDWATPGDSAFFERVESPIAVAAFNPNTPSGRGDILQSGGSCSSAVDSITDRLLHRLQYTRRCDGTEVLIANHTVNANGSTACSTSGTTFQAGVRVYELQRTTGAANPFSIANQMTFAPDGHSRWMASAGIDHQGDLALGYSTSSLTLFPSVRYTGRLASAPANTLQAEATLVSGTGIQTDSLYHRWGDYSMLALDPTDQCTFWMAQEYYTAASQATSTVGWLTRIGSFKFSTCAPLIFCTDFEAGDLGDWD